MARSLDEEVLPTMNKSAEADARSLPEQQDTESGEVDLARIERVYRSVLFLQEKNSSSRM